jgi:hypothetical protein
MGAIPRMNAQVIACGTLKTHSEMTLVCCFTLMGCFEMDCQA